MSRSCNGKFNARAVATPSQPSRAGPASTAILAALFVFIPCGFSVSYSQENPGASAPRVQPQPEERQPTPPPREDEPNSNESDTHEEEGRDAPNYRGGCPYRGKSLDLIV